MKPNEYWIREIHTDYGSHWQVFSSGEWLEDEELVAKYIHVITKEHHDELVRGLVEALREASYFKDRDDVNGEAGDICWRALSAYEQAIKGSE